jgi:phosphocarrier protein HPr
MLGKVDLYLKGVDKSETEVEVRNSLGIHVRTAALLTKTALHFLSSIQIVYGAESVNARSAIDLIALGVGPGAHVKISARGPDADAAVAAIKKLFEEKFGED